MKSKMVIGLDGGGTKTLGVVVDEQGCVLSRAKGESSNIQVIGGEKVGWVVRDLVKTLLSHSASATPIVHLYAGLAGAGRPADREVIHRALESHHLAERITIDTDASAALAGAFAGGPGIIVISGTGAICFGKSDQGVVYRCGGWGYLLGDEGSGYYIGQQALIAALKHLDGRGPQTVLKSAIEEKYQVASVDLLISLIYSGKIDRAEIAALAPMVFSLSEEGDEVSRQIIINAGLEIGKIIAAVGKKLGLAGKKAQVALIGSVFNQRRVLIPFMQQEACRVVEEVSFIDPQFEPAIGAAIMALQQEKITINPTMITNLNRTAGTFLTEA